MKKLLSMSLALVMMMALMLPAMAVDTTQITVDGTGQAYKAWRLLDAVEVPGEGEGAESTYTYSLNDAAHTNVLLKALGITETDEAKQLAAITAALSVDGFDAADFAAKVFHAIDDAKLPADAAAGADGKFGDVAQGYWLIAETTAADTNDALSFLMLDTAGQSVLNPTAKPTNGDSIPKVDKTLDDGDKGTGMAKVGDVVSFVITGTVPTAAAKYENAYEYTFHDKPVNLGVLNDTDHPISVQVDGADIEATVTTTDNADGCGLEVYIADARAYAGKSIVLKYDARVLDTAAAGMGSNKNTVNVEFSNNPYGEGTGTTVPTDPEDPIPENEVVVLVYNVDLYNIINGTESSDAPYSTDTLLSGGFTLQVKGEDGTWTDIEWKNLNAEDAREGDPTQHRWTQLTDGDYRIVQDSAQAGYAAEDAVEFTIATTITDKKPTNVEVTSDKEGFVVDVNFTKGEVDLVIPNAPGSKLPATGGAGVYALYAAGVVCVIAAVGAVVVVTKRRNKTEG